MLNKKKPSRLTELAENSIWFAPQGWTSGGFGYFSTKKTEHYSLQVSLSRPILVHEVHSVTEREDVLRYYGIYDKNPIIALDNGADGNRFSGMYSPYEKKDQGILLLSKRFAEYIR